MNPSSHNVSWGLSFTRAGDCEPIARAFEMLPLGLLNFHLSGDGPGTVVLEVLLDVPTRFDRFRHHVDGAETVGGDLSCSTRTNAMRSLLSGSRGKRADATRPALVPGAVTGTFASLVVVMRLW